jgi:hypothetical protein
MAGQIYAPGNAYLNNAEPVKLRGPPYGFGR